MYNIYKGRIKSVDKVKFLHGITTYTIGDVQDSLSPTNKNRIFYNILHNYQTDPDSADGQYRPGTLVFFTADSSGSDGSIIAAIGENPGLKLKVNPAVKDDDLSKIFKTSDAPPVTSGDWLWQKMEALVMFAYSGLIRLRSKLGLEIVMSPETGLLKVVADKIRVFFSSLNYNVLEVNNQDGKVDINLAFTTDTIGDDKDASLLQAKLGQISKTEKAKRVFFSIINIFTKKANFTLDVDKDGQTEIKLKNIKLNINDKAEVFIDSDGKTYFRVPEYYLGQGDVKENFIRGKEFAKNYKELLSLLKYHTHINSNSPSAQLQKLVIDKELQIDKELSKNNFLN
jgi:hypothetical protein